jgi:hypothetical protein
MKSLTCRIKLVTWKAFEILMSEKTCLSNCQLVSYLLTIFTLRCIVLLCIKELVRLYTNPACDEKNLTVLVHPRFVFHHIVNVSTRHTHIFSLSLFPSLLSFIFIKSLL